MQHSIICASLAPSYSSNACTYNNHVQCAHGEQYQQSARILPKHSDVHSMFKAAAPMPASCIKDPRPKGTTNKPAHTSLPYLHTSSHPCMQLAHAFFHACLHAIRACILFSHVFMHCTHDFRLTFSLCSVSIKRTPKTPSCVSVLECVTCLSRVPTKESANIRVCVCVCLCACCPACVLPRMHLALSLHLCCSKKLPTPSM